MRVRILRGVTGDTPYTELLTVKDGTSVVFLEPSVIAREPHARFYDDQMRVHQIPARELVEVAP